MKFINLGSTGLAVSEVALGCMRMNAMSTEQAAAHIAQCIECGINFFDNADIYGAGASEERFAQAFSRLNIRREDIIVQSKCGIVPGIMYDLSKAHIVESVDGILKRLNLEYLDVLVLHRPDALVEPEEVAAAFDCLQSSGKVRYFGVSNHKPSQIELLKKYVKQDLIVNQLQLSLPCSNMIANGLEVNMTSDGALERDGSVLDYCRLNDITVQAWSPFQSPNWQGPFIDSERYPELNGALCEVGEKYGISKTTVAAAWILRHPAKIQVVAGTMNGERIKEIAAASDITLTKEEWYKLYIAAGHILP